jgi:hypothetical protein
MNKSCLFCNSRVKSKEDVWPKWVIKLLKNSTDEKVPMKTRRYIEPPKEWMTNDSLLCGWKRSDNSLPVSMQTINHDHTALTHMFNVARSSRFKLIQDNRASHVEKPDPKNERDRIASAEEWAKLKATAVPHLFRFLSIAYAVGPRRGVAQAGMAGRRYEAQGVHASEDQEWGNTSSSHDP